MAERTAVTAVENIVPSCQWVMQQARHVKIRQDKIDSYTSMLLSRYALITAMDANMHYTVGEIEEKAAYLLALDSINFGSGYFHIAKSCGAELEYEVIAGGLKKAFEQGLLNKPEQWCRVTPEDMARLLSIPQGKDDRLDKLLVSFALHLQESGTKIQADYQGKVMHLLEQAGNSAVNLANSVAAWPCFQDKRLYQGKEVPFLKRAQILAADLHLSLSIFGDMDGLTIFADNMVPHVLRCDGVLEYDADLAERIDQGKLIAEGSEEEVEIRAAAITAVEMMKHSAQRQGRNITSVNLDHLLWHRGYEPDIYQKPSHRTLTVTY